MSKDGYITPKGVDERIIDYPPIYNEDEVVELESLGIQFISWNGFTIAVGPGFTTEWFDEVASRNRKRQSVILAISGAPGEGKTWGGLRLAEIFDKKFNVKNQVCFTREQLAKIISGEVKLRWGQCLLIDEAHMATGARHWVEQLQKELVDQLAAIRSKGLIVIIVVLHINMIDKILREYALTYQLHMEERGLATIYKLTMPRFESKIYRYGRGSVALSVPGESECPSPDCLECEHLDWCGNMRAIYERQKKGFLEATSSRMLKKMEQIRVRDEMTKKEKVDYIFQHKDLLRYTNRGTIDPTSIQIIFEEAEGGGMEIGQSQASTLAKRVHIAYPDLRPPEKRKK